MERLFPQQAQHFVAALVGLAMSTSPLREADDPRTSVTLAEIQAANDEAREAYNALVSMWSGELNSFDAEFKAPRFLRYRVTTRTPCGVVAPANAIYCFDNNTIYYDDAFLAEQTKLTGRALGTDGDMAAVGIIAHEMGHAVAMQLGVRSAKSQENESIADCLAGAFARYSQGNGLMDKGDLDEALHAVSLAGDPDPSSLGKSRRDRRRAAMIARDSHGTREQRIASFRDGFAGGGGACLEELR